MDLPTGNSYMLARAMLITRIVTTLRQLDTAGQNQLIAAYWAAGGEPALLQTALDNVEGQGGESSVGRGWLIAGGALIVAGVSVLVYSRYRRTHDHEHEWEPAMMGSGRRGMSMATFIRENKADIDRAIKSVCSNCSLNDRDRRAWINNDEGLYRWARSEGVRI
jgi:hypothetical protein